MKAIAVDDEPLALSVIKIFCRKSTTIDLVEQFTNGREALQYLNEHEDIDLIFLDINMPHLSGVEVAKMVARRAMIIFTTAYQDYAVEGFELEAVDYLMKPFSYERFNKATERAHELLILRKNKDRESASKDVSHIMIKSDSSLIKVEIDSIIIIEGLKDYIRIVTTNKRYVTKSTMKNIEQNLGGFGFVRVQKSYVVNMNRVISFEGGTLTMEGNVMVPVGLQYRSSFIDLFAAHRVL